jgi:hypothetical protein
MKLQICPRRRNIYQKIAKKKERGLRAGGVAKPHVVAPSFSCRRWIRLPTHPLEEDGWGEMMGGSPPSTPCRKRVGWTHPPASMGGGCISLLHKVGGLSLLPWRMLDEVAWPGLSIFLSFVCNFFLAKFSP